jgi:hypothetical protein
MLPHLSCNRIRLTILADPDVRISYEPSFSTGKGSTGRPSRRASAQTRARPGLDMVANTRKQIVHP